MNISAGNVIISLKNCSLPCVSRPYLHVLSARVPQKRLRASSLPIHVRPIAPAAQTPKPALPLSKAAAREIPAPMPDNSLQECLLRLKNVNS